jgi:protein-L-isoaspartate(D-aspartate) O-methyltransferase
MFSDKIPGGSDKMKGLIKKLISRGILKSKKVGDVMLQVDRGDFTDKKYAYMDSAQDMGCGATISAPHMHAYALELLKDHLKPGGRSLDVGSGSGYL